MKVATRPSRPMHTVVLDHDQKYRVLTDINEYLHPAMPKWYTNRGIPYRRGYVLFGAFSSYSGYQIGVVRHVLGAIRPSCRSNMLYNSYAICRVRLASKSAQPSLPRASRHRKILASMGHCWRLWSGHLLHLTSGPHLDRGRSKYDVHKLSTTLCGPSRRH